MCSMLHSSLVHYWCSIRYCQNTGTEYTTAPHHQKTQIHILKMANQHAMACRSKSYCHAILDKNSKTSCRETDIWTRAKTAKETWDFFFVTITFLIWILSFVKTYWTIGKSWAKGPQKLPKVLKNYLNNIGLINFRTKLLAGNIERLVKIGQLGNNVKAQE